jgi:hypothetical protein
MSQAGHAPAPGESPFRTRQRLVQIRLILIGLWCSPTESDRHTSTTSISRRRARIQQLLVSFPSRRFRRCLGAKILGILVAHRPGQRGWDSNCGVENLQRKVNSNSLEWGAKILGISPGDLGAGCSPKRGKSVRANAQRVRVRGIQDTPAIDSVKTAWIKAVFHRPKTFEIPRIFARPQPASATG